MLVDCFGVERRVLAGGWWLWCGVFCYIGGCSGILLLLITVCVDVFVCVVVGCFCFVVLTLNSVGIDYVCLLLGVLL